LKAKSRTQIIYFGKEILKKQNLKTYYEKKNSEFFFEKHIGCKLVVIQGGFIFGIQWWKKLKPGLVRGKENVYRLLVGYV